MTTPDPTRPSPAVCRDRGQRTRCWLSSSRSARSPVRERPVGSGPPVAPYPGRTRTAVACSAVGWGQGRPGDGGGFIGHASFSGPTALGCLVVGGRGPCRRGGGRTVGDGLAARAER